jgi:hypothetical protein
MNNAGPSKTPQGCPQCRSLLPEGSRNCRHCGKSLRRLKLSRRTAIGGFVGVLALAVACGVNRSLPPSGELTTDAEELVVKPHSTFWKLLNPITKGELTHQVDAGDVPIGINASPIGEGGLNKELNDKMMATQIAVAAGRQGEVKQSVETGQAYAVYIINETDKPAKATLRSTLRWGPTQP